MSYQDWLKLVDQALIGANRGFTTSAINSADLQAAFLAGTSPVIFARQASPNAVMQPAGAPAPQTTFPSWYNSVPFPDTFLTSMTVRILTILGWLIWVTGLLGLAFWLFIFVAGLIGSKTDELPIIAASGPMFLVIAGMVTFFWLVLGSVCHWLAQHLSLAFHSN